jgi:hypothetical protein
MRTMDNLHLINFMELQLKSKEEFATAYDMALAGGLKKYLKKFVVVQPGDWPSQFYGRQIVYEYVTRQTQNFQINSGSITSNGPTSSTPRQPMLNVPAPSITSVVPTMGPLHISLNSREHIFMSFKPFFKKVYCHLFPGCKLAETPKPWRINLILEIVYGGWTLIRERAKVFFQYSKDLQYGTLLNLLDNYLPLVLSIYTITFKTNNFKEYYNAMVRIWVMFVCLKRRHYNKAPLVWLSCTNHWAKNYSELYDHFCKWPTIFDEYPVENTHSILRAQTKPSDTAEKLTNRAKSIFESKQRQANFRSIFIPPKEFNFSQQQLQFLKAKCAQLLTSILSMIHSKPGSASMTKEKKTRYVCLPDKFGMIKMKYIILPLGFNATTVPNENCRCDNKSCTINNPNEPWQLFQGCWHSFHKTCLNGTPSCPLCKELLTKQVQELGLVAKEAILHPRNDRVTSTNECTDADTEDTNTMKAPEIPECVDLQKINETVNDINSKIYSLKSPPKPYQENITHAEVPVQRVVTHPANDQSHAQNNISQQETQPSKMCSKPVRQTPQKRIEVVTRNDLPGITEWLLPTNICQTRICGRTLASNACTIIAALCCRSFLKRELEIPLDAELGNAINKFKQLIMTGNMLYGGLRLPCNQPNLEVCDVLKKIVDLKLTMVKDLGFFYAEDIYETLCQLLQCEGRQAGVLIFPPDKSLALLADNDEVAVFDSHEHGQNGGIITVCRSKNIDDFFYYLQTNGTLDGYNFSQLALDN